jgi:hypothetical protein
VRRVGLASYQMRACTCAYVFVSLRVMRNSNYSLHTKSVFGQKQDYERKEINPKFQTDIQTDRQTYSGPRLELPVLLLLLLLLLFNCNWVDTRWQQYSSHLRTNSTAVQFTFTHKQYSSTVHIYTQTVQQYSSHLHTTVQQYSSQLHTNSTQNTQNIHNNHKIEHA